MIEMEKPIVIEGTVDIIGCCHWCIGNFADYNLQDILQASEGKKVKITIEEE